MQLAGFISGFVQATTIYMILVGLIFFHSDLPVTGSLSRQPQVLYNSGLSVPIGWDALFEVPLREAYSIITKEPRNSIFFD